jgi:hypothetical protein
MNKKIKEKKERWRSSKQQSKKELELILSKYFDGSGTSRKKEETIKREKLGYNAAKIKNIYI